MATLINSDNRFDIDLAYGRLREDAIAKLLHMGTDKIEVKTDRGQWKKTDNLCIEIGFRGKPSGLKTTQADWWCHVFMDGDNIYSIIFLPMRILKGLAKQYLHTRKFIGDDNQAECILIPLHRVLTYSIKELTNV